MDTGTPPKSGEAARSSDEAPESQDHGNAATSLENQNEVHAATDAYEQQPAENWDHEASTSGAGETPNQFFDRSWLASPASTSTQHPEASPLERTLSELAFSRFRNSMRVEARRSSARRSLLGRLGALPTDETSLTYPPQEHAWDLQGHVLPFQGQGGDFHPGSGVLPPEESTEHSSAAPETGEVISAYERFAKAEFAEHIYGIGRLIWKRISVEDLVQHSRVNLRAPLLRRLATSPLSPKAATVFAHLKGYMEDPSLPEPSQQGQFKFLDTVRLMKTSILQKLEPIRLKLEPVRDKLDLLRLKIEKILHTKLSVPRTRLFHLQQILLIGIKYEELRDEIFCQICKQTTRNPTRVSDARGWQAMAVCVGTFPPSHNFRPVLEEHLKQVADGIVRGISGFNQPDKAQETAPYCLERLQKITQVGTRHIPPSSDEILAAEHMQKTPINVNIPGGNAQVISLDSMTTGGEVTAEIAGRLGLEDTNFYGIFVVVNGVERFAGTQGFVLEAYTEWNIAPIPVLEEESEVFRKTRQFLVGQCANCLYNLEPDSVLGKDLAHGISAMRKQKEKEKEASGDTLKVDEEMEPEMQKLYSDIHLLLKKNLFPVEDKASGDFSRARAFEYAQATHDVVHGLYVLEETDAVMLAALQLRAEHGSSADLENYLTIETVENYGPKEYVTGYEKAWRSAILKKVATLPWEVDINVCRNDYLEFLRSRHPLYGSSWFYVLPKLCPQLPREIYLVLNLSGVSFVDAPMKEQLLHLRFIEICSWGHSDSSFSLVTGNMSYNMEFRLGTRNGKEIAQTLQYFIKSTQN